MDRSRQPGEERCTECGFRWSVPLDEAIALVDGAAERYAHWLTGGAGPPSEDPHRWSAAGYLWHVVDVVRLGTERLWTLTLAPGSEVPGWDQEALAAARRYERLPVAVGLVALEAATRDWVQAAREAPDDAHVEHPVFGRLGRADSIRRNAHEAHHHGLDIRRALGVVDPTSPPDQADSGSEGAARRDVVQGTEKPREKEETVTGPTIEQLREQVRGQVVAPDDDGYDEARRVYNAMIDRSPGVVVRPANAGDVIASVNFARENGLDLAIRGGGHSVPGFGTCDRGVVIDLAGMRGVRVDPTKRTARAEGGATWGDFNAAAHAFGLATTGGIISTTGVAGLTLGGGIGYLDRGFGLSCDNLVSADVVTADGRLLVANERDNADLFWAIRGGGGNFGVATSLEFALHPVETIYGGPMFFELSEVGNVLRFFREYIADAPEQMGAFPAFQIAPPLPFIPEDRHGDTFIAMVACWAGPLNEGEKALKPFHDLAPVVAEFVGPMPYPALNSAFDALVPPGLQHYWKASFVTELTDDIIAAHEVHGPKVPAVNSTVHIYPINGACHRVASDETAFAYRDANFATVIAGMWPDPADNEANTAWVRDYYAATSPFSEEGGYINFMAADDQDRIKANYRGNYDRLVEVKRTYDPGNLFHVNQNIKP